ncbi:MAG: hypothetical protein HYU35_00945 [Parcubacteria group bacterium]|nr:hypothetical protein [Parcubacteria group bacterium]
MWIQNEVVELLKKAIKEIPHSADVKLFARAFSAEGWKLGEKLQSELGQTIQLKEK